MYSSAEAMEAPAGEDWHKSSDPVQKALRQGFVRKVYGILTAQLTLTFGLIFVFVFVDSAKRSLCGMSADAPADCFSAEGSANAWDPSQDGGGAPGPGQCNLDERGGCRFPTDSLQTALTACSILSLVFVVGIVCCETCSRKYPTNYIALFAFTGCEAVTLAIVCLFENAASVGLAAAMTALVTAGLTAYACKTDTDFTGMGAYLYAALLTLVVFGVVGSFFSAFYHTPWMQNLYAGAGALIFSLYIVYDTQLIVGGAHKKHQFGLDDYVFAALNIYLDIINLFLYILRMLSSRD